MSEQEASSPGAARQDSAPVEASNLDEALAQVLRLLDENPDAALTQAEKLLRVHPDPRLFRLAAEACRKLGLDGDAVSAELAAIQAGFSNRELERAAIAQSEGRPNDAFVIAEQFLRGEPDDLLALTIAAEAAVSSWELERAETML